MPSLFVLHFLTQACWQITIQTQNSLEIIMNTFLAKISLKQINECFHYNLFTFLNFCVDMQKILRNQEQSNKSNTISQNKLVRSMQTLNILDRISKYFASKRLSDRDKPHIMWQISFLFMKYSIIPQSNIVYGNGCTQSRTVTSSHSLNFNKPLHMLSPKMILSFALNPITNTLEFVTVPEIDFKQPERSIPTKSEQKNCEKSQREDGQIMLKNTADRQEAAQARRQMKADDENDLDRRLSSLIRSVHNGSSCLQPYIDEILQMGSKTPTELLVMMEYTQKLSYLRFKCEALPCITKKLCLQINRVIQWVLREQEEYCMQLCGRFLPYANK